MKTYHINLMVVGSKRGDIYTEQVSLVINDNTEISNIMDFMDGAKKIYKKVMKATRRGHLVDLEITRAVYDLNYYDAHSDDVNILEKEFDFWVFDRYSDVGDGIHMRSDTPAGHDFWLTKDIMHDLISI